MQLKDKKKYQEKELNRVMREHHMCMREIIFNIEEVEDLTKKTIDEEVLKELLHKCPIDL